MNAVLCLAVFAVAVAIVTGEPCSHVSECSHVTCDAGHDLQCHHSTSILGGAVSGQCTCKSDDGCTTQADCGSDCRRPHCVDGDCHCGFGGFGGVGK